MRRVFKQSMWSTLLVAAISLVFWTFALGRIKRRDIEGLIGCTLIAHHLITFARAASSGKQNASNYSIRLREAAVPAE